MKKISNLLFFGIPSLAYYEFTAGDFTLGNFEKIKNLITDRTVIFWTILAIIWIVFLHSKIQSRIHSLVTPTEKVSDDKNIKGITNAIAFAILSGIVIISILLIFDYKTHISDNSNKKIGELLGTYGDFFGGVLNPILTFFTLIALAITVVMQRIELRDANIAAKENSTLSRLQTFETTFFNLLNLHNTTVQDLRMDSNHLIKTLYDSDKIQIATKNSSLYSRTEVRNLDSYTGRLVFNEILRILVSAPGQKAISIYEIIQSKHNYLLGRYFRNLYQILEFIDTYAKRYTHDSEIFDLPGKRYADIVRAQLSSDELLLLLYNCSGTIVDDGEFRELLMKYELLEHIPLEITKKRITVPGHADNIIDIVDQYFYIYENVYDPGAFGANEKIEMYLMEFYNYDSTNRIEKKILKKHLQKHANS